MKLSCDIPFSTCQLAALIEDLSAGCEAEFDADHEELERQFAELRMTFDR
ncbi:MAG TPA: hypothetical protein VHC22_21775 [Pirellulales bacterium]|nr:hypothetical protein [Pirellulales bacterium]